MSGALLQLAALGSQDVYLTGSPEITLFKSMYHRYTHFAIETVQVAFDGGFINIDCSDSSQFLTGFLLASNITNQSLHINILNNEIISYKFIEMTLRIFKKFN